MTIKEIETRSGLARANIRFYEAEGLLTPERRPNGYRDYSGEDLQTLLRVRLLRSLGVSLEDIKAIQAGNLPLPEALERHLEQMAGERERLDRSVAVCREMKEAGEDYARLDAEKYLEELAQARPVPVPVPKSDALPTVRSPWRRYFARSLDAVLYSTILDGIFLACGLNHLICLIHASSYEKPLQAVLPMLLMSIGFGLLITIVLEPILLHHFGTTPGKALLGLHVQDPDGGKLSYDKAVFRTGSVLLRGLGLGIPVVCEIQQIRSCSACEKGKTLPWEEDTVLVLRDEKTWRTAVFVVLFVALYLGSVSISMMAELPVHRGDLTVAEFCDNFNRQADILGYTKARLNPSGTWQEQETYGVLVMEDTLGPALPDIQFTETDGAVTGLSFILRAEGQDFYASWGQRETALALWAFVGAQKACGVLHRDLTARYNDLLDNPIHSFDDTLYGVRVRCDAQWEGEPGAFLARPDDGPAAFRMSVKMEKQ